ncbi:MAG: fused MFS/spermidine synthase [Vicinamibacteria bacterium]|nr:fused MFS/spermidine synthase [Vicinamibacteria bacterium]
MRRSASLLVAFLAGFVALSYEILWFRVFAFASGGAAPTFALLLGAYLLGLAWGSRLAARICARMPEQVARHRAFLVDYLLLANVLGFLLIPAVARLMTIFPYWNVWLCLVIPVTALLGAVYPLVNHLGVPADARVGRHVGHLYFVNILGSTVGSVGTGFYLLDRWSLSQVAMVIAFTGIASAMLPLASLPRGRGRVFRAALAIAAISVALFGARPLFVHLYERLQYQTYYTPTRVFVQTIENRAGVINVTAGGVVYGGGLYDGQFNTGLKNDKNDVIRTYAGLSLHPAPRDVLLVGLSTGSWAQIISHHPQIEALTVVEINRGYLRLFPSHPSSRSLLTNPKVRIEIDDGRRWLVRNPNRRFDLVMVHIWHWPANATNLLSREALDILRAHLKPGGILYYSTTGSARVQRTGALSFPHALRIMNWLAVSDAPFVYRSQALLRLIESYRIDEVPQIAPDESNHSWLLKRIARLQEQIEARKEILSRTADLDIVTDDNMGTEWTEYPLWPPLAAN